MTQQNSDVHLKMIDYVAESGEGLAAAEKLAREVNAEKQAAAKKADTVADALVEARLVPHEERDEALRKMGSHVGCVEIIKNLVDHHVKTTAAYQKKLAAQGNGEPMSEKTAQAGGSPTTSSTGPYVGRRAGLGEIRPSDTPLRRLAGLSST